MATESVDRANNAGEAEQVLSIQNASREFYRERWADCGLSVGVETHLAAADRAACGLDGVTEILRRNSRNRRNRDAFVGVVYNELSVALTEELEAAEEALLDVIRNSLEIVRDQVHKHSERAMRR